MTALILLLVFLSGFTGLVYQVIWQKYLSAYLGSHALATSQVLACFFLFMAIGYFAIGRYQHRLIKNKVFLYGVIEGLIGAYALVSPDLFFWLTQSFSFYGETALTDFIKSFLLTGLFIGLPTFLMGGTIPVLTHGLVKAFQKSHKVHSWIYSINTVGAFVGTLMGGFYFIENYGLPFSLMIVGVLNILIMLVCYFIWKLYPNHFQGLDIVKVDEKKIMSDETPHFSHKWHLYLISFLSGFYVFGLENIIIKVAGLSLGSSTYTYSIVVSAFILAIAIGSTCVSLFKKIDSIKLLYKIQLLLLVSIIALYLFIPYWPMILNRINLLISKNLFNFEIKWFLVLIFFLLILLIPVSLMGVNLPLLFAYLKEQKQYLSKTVGRLYGINSIGGFLGAILGGYYILKWFPLDLTMKFYFVFVALTLFIVISLFDNYSLKKKIILNSSITTFSIICVLVLPSWKVLTFTPGSFLKAPILLPNKSYSEWYNSQREEIEKQNEVLFSQSGPNTWAVVLEDKIKQKTLFVNGKADASTQGDFIVRALNMLIPITIKKEIEDIFIVGLGASLSTGIATKFNDVKHVDVAEISQGVINSMPFFNEHAFNVLDRKHKFTVFHTDAYRKLKSQKKKYDLIVSEPSNLWVTGVELLFSIEFLEEARNHLKEGGVYSQWFPLFEADEDMFRMVIANFNSVFPWVTIWLTTPNTINIIASMDKLKVSEENLISKFNEQNEMYKLYGFNDFQSLLGMQALPEGTTRGIVADVKTLHTIEWPKLENMANRSGFIGKSTNLNNFLLAKLYKPLPVADPSYKFLYEEVFNTPSEIFFKDNISRYEKMNVSEINFYRRRLIYQYQKQYANAEKKLNDKIKQGLDFLITGLNSPKIDLKENFQSYVNQLEIFKYGIAMHLPVQLENVKNLLPPKCESDKSCVKAKKHFLKIVGNKTDMDLESLEPNEYSKIEEDYKLFN